MSYNASYWRLEKAGFYWEQHMHKSLCKCKETEIVSIIVKSVTDTYGMKTPYKVSEYNEFHTVKKKGD